MEEIPPAEYYVSTSSETSISINGQSVFISDQTQAKPGQQEQGTVDIIKMSDPIAQVMIDQEMGKVMVVVAIGAIGWLVVLPVEKHLPVIRDVLVSLACFGFSFILIGILLRNLYPRAANIFEQIGVAFVLAAFFGAISWSLPVYSNWVPLVCLGLCILVFLWNFYLATFLQSATTVLCGPK
ncbi:OLC1v1031203C2 [Oldenlandia corymbosa var. corymbosa]|uniref:OLC1v1031203C2 n=1 Tax=Oldenlandia corymbosa var. corymbosa TaxID=529605 RepID=A0AAV1CIE3_OLDCO|nr:OLC1v1031203C2 [Oldenlandia corymbosa var. corymbosa]